MLEAFGTAFGVFMGYDLYYILINFNTLVGFGIFFITQLLLIFDGIFGYWDVKREQ